MEPSGSFSVKSILHSTYASHPYSSPICSLAWNNLVPHRIQLFIWTALKKRILVKHNLMRRRVIPAEASVVCPLCEVEEETVDHLLCKCRFTWVVWYSFLRLVGCSWVLSSDVEELVESWMRSPFRRRHRVAWKMISFVVSWAIWKSVMASDWLVVCMQGVSGSCP